MTFQELLGKSADELDKLTDAELEVYFAPYLEITRPVKKTGTINPKTVTTKTLAKPANFEAFVASVLGKKGLDAKKILKK